MELSVEMVWNGIYVMNRMHFEKVEAGFYTVRGNLPQSASDFMTANVRLSGSGAAHAHERIDALEARLLRAAILGGR